MSDTTDDTPTDSSNATEHDPERVDDVEIERGDTFLDLTEADQQLVVVETVGDVTEIAPDAPVPDEFEGRVERSPEAVIVRTDATGDHVALDAQTFRRFVLQGVVRRVKRPKQMWALLHAANRDELHDMVGGGEGGAS